MSLSEDMLTGWKREAPMICGTGFRGIDGLQHICDNAWAIIDSTDNLVPTSAASTRS